MQKRTENRTQNLKYDIDKIQKKLDDTYLCVRDFMGIFEATLAEQLKRDKGAPAEETENRHIKMGRIIKRTSHAVRGIVLRHQSTVDKLQTVSPIGERFKRINETLCRLNELCDRMDTINMQQHQRLVATGGDPS